MATRRILALAVLLALVSGCDALSNLTSPGTSPDVPDVEGRWTGTLDTTSCTADTPALAAWCALVASGEPVPFVLALAQFEDELAGSLQAAGALVPVAGSIDEDGRMQLSGSATAPIEGVGTVTVSVEGWDTTAAGGVLQGGWTSEARTTDATARATHVIAEAARTAG